MDRLTELFANKPTSYTGLGLAYVGDTRGNAVVSGEQGLEVIPRIRADEGGITFKGAWAPTFINATTISLTPGTVADGFTTLTPSVSSISVNATSLNYVYLECDITLNTDDGFIMSGRLVAAQVKAYTTLKTPTASKAYLLLCEVQAEEVVARYYWQSVQFMVHDDMTKTTTPRVNWFT